MPEIIPPPTSKRSLYDAYQKYVLDFLDGPVEDEPYFLGFYDEFDFEDPILADKKAPIFVENEAVYAVSHPNPAHDELAGWLQSAVLSACEGQIGEVFRAKGSGKLPVMNIRRCKHGFPKEPDGQIRPDCDLRQYPSVVIVTTRHKDHSRNAWLSHPR